MKISFNLKSYIFLFCLFAFLTACENDTKKSTDTTDNEPKKFQIVTTTGMLKDAVLNIVGDKAEVTSLMGVGIDPHYYKATQNDLTQLTNADAIFYNGLYLEGKMEEILKKLATKKKVFGVGDELDKSKLRKLYEGKDDSEESVGEYDPHIWFDVELWADVVQIIGQKMQDLDKNNAEIYAQNTQNYIEILTALHKNNQKEIKSIAIDDPILITSHDAFEYLGRAYDIEVKGLQGISTVTEPGLKDITNMVDLIIKKGVKTIFVESSIPKKSLQAVVEGCKRKGHNIEFGTELFSDAMGEEGTKEGTYIGMVQHNIKAIVEGLK